MRALHRQLSRSPAQYSQSDQTLGVRAITTTTRRTGMGSTGNKFWTYQSRATPISAAKTPSWGIWSKRDANHSTSSHAACFKHSESWSRRAYN